MTCNGVLLDTSFFIRFSGNERLSEEARNYYQYFLEHNMLMYVSTISIAEYCTKGDIEDLPIKALRILPFNLQHATQAGSFAKTFFAARHAKALDCDRLFIPNDTKLFSQCHSEPHITSFVTSDAKCSSAFSCVEKSHDISFKIIDIHTPCAQQFGKLL